jgi:hypothetical protein
MNAAPAIVNSATPLIEALTATGRLDEGRELADEVSRIVRGLGGNEFFAVALRIEAELERARGNLNAARAALEEAVEVVLEAPTFEHVRTLLVPAATLLPRQRAEELLERVRPAVQDPSGQARVTEAEAILSGDRERFASAADLYASLELPYEEARCRLEAGDIERAGELIERFGLQNGPLGARLEASRSGAAQ